MKKLVYFHTAGVLEEVFKALTREYDAAVEIGHIVDADVLADLKARGQVDEDIAMRIRGRIQEAIDSGADLVVCTCSSVGGPAEAMDGAYGVPVQRIDRAMADQAVAEGSNIVLAATLQSTVEPTRELLESSAKRAGKRIDIREVLILEAWPKFEAEDKDGFWQDIAEVLRKETADADAVVLAQASMAGAAELLMDFPVPVLSSPRLGVERALRSLGITV